MPRTWTSIPERDEFITSPVYQEILNQIIDIVKEEYSKAPSPWPYTIHDDTHCQNVEKYFYTLIPREFYKHIRPRERFILLAAIWLHDIGMIPTLFSNKKNFINLPKDLPADRSVNTLRLSTPDGQKYLKEIRKNHADRSSLYIHCSKQFEKVEKIYGKHKKDSQYKQDIEHIAKICCLHPHKAYTELEKLNEENWIGRRVRVPLLAAYLRLADAIHIPDKGTELDFLNFLAQGPDELAKFHWFKSKFTKAIVVYPKKHEIKVVTKEPPNLESSLKGRIDSLQEQIKLEIEDELDSVKDILCKGGLSTYSKVTTAMEEDTNLDSEDLIVEYEQVLKSIDLIFNTTKTPSSSLIAGNIIETLKIFLKSGSLEQKRLYLEMYQNSCLADVEKIKSVHALLKRPLEKVKKFVADEKQSSYNDLLKEVDNWKKIRRKNLDKLSSFAAGVFADSSPILLYGYSDTILECIRYFIKKYPENTLNLYVCEVRSRTKYRYNNRLAFSDGLLNIEALKQIHPDRITIHYIPDAAVAHLFANNTIDNSTNFKVVLSVNAIDYEGNATHTVGARTIVEIASIYKIPVYVVAESSKILSESSDKVKTNLIEITRNNPKDRGKDWLTTDIHFEMILNGCSSYNPREDVILSKFITSFITEKGITRPELIKNVNPEQDN